MQFHKGLRLKKIIEKKFKRTKDFAHKIGFTEQKLQYYFNREDIKTASLLPILEALGMTYEQFMTMKNTVEHEEENILNDGVEPYGTNEIIKALKSENQTLKEYIATLKETIEILKQKM